MITSWYSYFFLFSVSAFAIFGDSQVALLGESYSGENSTSGINEEVLGQLFSLMREKNPQAVIFTGNMTLGLEDANIKIDSVQNLNQSYLSAASETGIEEESWPRKGYSYNSDYFKKELTAFITLKNKTLGDKIDFHPIISNHESFGSDSAEAVLKAFNVKNYASQDASTLAYTFSLNNTIFILFSNARFNPLTQRSEEHSVNPELLNWMSGVLKTERGKYDFAFVIGSEPAFSTSEANGIYKGLDVHTKNRNRFWQTLLEYHVTAYFCSGEHLYDRTNRYGIWQIISGGAGAPFYKRAFDKAFYHFLLLTIPENKERFPKVQVYDAQGALFDEFELIPAHYPVYQLRISKNSNDLCSPQQVNL